MTSDIRLAEHPSGVEPSDVLGIGASQPCANTSAYILGLGHRFQVVRVHATRISTQVIERHSIRDRASLLPIEQSVRPDPLSVDVRHPIPVMVERELPIPTSGRVINDVVHGRQAPMVAGQELDELAKDHTLLSAGSAGARNGVTATAHAQTARVRGSQRRPFSGMTIAQAARFAARCFGVLSRTPAINTRFVTVGMHSGDLLGRSIGATPSAVPAARGFSVA